MSSSTGPRRTGTQAALQPRPVKPTIIKDVPFTSPKTVLSKYLSPGKVVEFRHQESASLALVSGPGNVATSQVDVTTSDGQASRVNTSQIVVVLPGKDHTLETVKSIEEHVATIDRGVLRSLWQELLVETLAACDGRPLGSETSMHFDILALSRRLWGSTAGPDLYATHRLLEEDSSFFFRLKTRPPTYHVRSEEEVTRLQQQQDFERKQAAFRKSFVGALKACLDGGSAPEDTWKVPEYADAMTHIAEYARGACNAPHGNALFALLDTGCDVSADGAAMLLKRLSFWPRHMPNPLLREELPLVFPRYVQSLAEDVAGSPPEDAAAVKRVDFTPQFALAIDDPITTEVDDAVAIEALPGGGWKLFVHVADPSALVSPADPLDLEAMSRARTLYLPWTKIPMFPSVLSENAFSLDGAKECPTLTFVATLAPDGALLHGEVHCGRAAATRATYDDVDAILAQPPSHERKEGLQDELHAMLHELNRFSVARVAWRAGNGAVDIPNMECAITVDSMASDAEPRVSLKPIAMVDSPARCAVMEAMVLAGEVAAKWGAANSVPLLFRAQDPPAMPSESALRRVAGARYARGFLWRTHMLKSTTSADAPRKHSALGLDAYCQVTSPIRRYTDLLCHYQIKAKLLGKTAPFPASALVAHVKRVEEKSKHHRALELSVSDHFLTLYFEQNPGGKYRAEVLGTNKDGSSQLQITDLGIERAANLNGAAGPGERRVVKPIVERLKGSVRWVDA